MSLDIVERLKALVALGVDAAGAPWFTAMRRADGLTTVEDGRENGLFSFHCEAFEAALIVGLRNGIEDISQAADEIVRLRKALQWYADFGENKFNVVDDKGGFITDLKGFSATARQALSGGTAQ